MHTNDPNDPNAGTVGTRATGTKDTGADGPAPRPAPRRGRIARRALIALAAAGAVAAGGLAVADRGDRGDRMVERIGDRLELDEAQARSLRELVDTVTELRGTLRGDGLGDEIRALTAQPTLDQAGAVAMIESRADAMRAAAPVLVANAAAFHDGLDDAQRAEVSEMLERVGRGRRGRGGHD